MTTLTLARLPTALSLPPASSFDPVQQAPLDDDLSAIRQLVTQTLAPQVLAIDLDAVYPEDFLRALGEVGGYRGAVPTEFGGNGQGMEHVIESMAAVSQTCLSTGFLVWCQTACARYIAMSDNAELRRTLLPRIVSGTLLAGTGLSNTVKSCDAVEDFRLSAKRVDGGYVVNGVLPWVSNLGPGHVFTTGCPVEDAGPGDDGLAFLLIDCGTPDFKLLDCAHFMGIDGTRTLACHFKNTFVADSMVLSHPGQSKAYVRRIKPGMILGQMGMCLGLTQACIDLIHQSNRTHAHVNRYLDDQEDELAAELAALRVRTTAAAQALQTNPLADIVLDILKLRLAGGELALRAAQSALLHMGAKGYLSHPG